MQLSLTSPLRCVATGAHMKNRACRIDGSEVSWSAQHGTLDSADNCKALKYSLSQLLDRERRVPHVLGHDMHQDYFSTQVAMQVAKESRIPVVAVQHHHAHIATTIAVCGIRSPVIGIALDGFGLGSNTESWGGEILLVDGGLSVHRCTRLAHLQPVSLPGGDKAAREPWRLVAGLLHDSGRETEILNRYGNAVGYQAASVVKQMLERQVNCPKSSSAGRWFDAAAGALGLCLYQSEEAEAAKKLENCAQTFLHHQPEFDYPWQSLNLSPVLAELLAVSPGDKAAVCRGAAMFHLALVNGLSNTVYMAARDHDIVDVALGGGCFMNSILRRYLRRRLSRMGLRVHVPETELLGDAGLALGQGWIASHYANAQRTSDQTIESVVRILCSDQFHEAEIC